MHLLWQELHQLGAQIDKEEIDRVEALAQVACDGSFAKLEVLLLDLNNQIGSAGAHALAKALNVQDADESRKLNSLKQLIMPTDCAKHAALKAACKSRKIGLVG